MLRNQENYIQRPYVFPPEGSSSYFSNMEVKSYHLEEAIMKLHHQILKQEDLLKFLQALKSYLPIVIELAPSSFHFILHAIQSVVENIDSKVPVDPVQFCILRQVFSSKVPDEPFFVRDLLDFKLREIAHYLLNLSFKTASRAMDEVYQEAGNIFCQEGNDFQAIFCYTQSLLENPKNAEIYYRRGMLYLNQGQHDVAIKDFEQALLIDPHHTKSVSLLAQIKNGQLSCGRI